MASWGYRVYTFELRSGRTPLAQEFEENRLRLLGALQVIGQCTRVGTPNSEAAEDAAVDDDTVADDEEYTDTQPTLTVRGSSYNRELATLHSSIALGERGLHDYAVDPTGNSERLRVGDRSAETPRRTDFYFASTGFEGFLITEMVGLKDPIPLLKRWIYKLSLEERKKRLVELDAQTEFRGPQGVLISKSAAQAAIPKALRIRVERVADPVLLDSILQSIESMDAEFTQLDSNNRETDKKLVIKVRQKNVQKKIADIFKAEASDDQAILKQTLAELDMDDDELKDANIDLTTVKAHIRSDVGAATLVPGRISDLFNYSFNAGGRPSNLPYYRTSLIKLDSLKGPEQMPIELPVVESMVEWVNREEAAWLPETSSVVSE